VFPDGRLPFFCGWVIIAAAIVTVALGFSLVGAVAIWFASAGNERMVAGRAAQPS